MASLFLILLPLVSLAWLILKNFNKQENSPPTPPQLPIIGNLHQLGHLPHRALLKLSKQYGPAILMQFGFIPTLVVTSAKTAEEILKTHDLHFCSRPSLVGTKRLSYNFRDIAFVPYGEYWREMRRICVSELFSTKRIQSFRCVREEEVGNMMKSISESTLSTVNLSSKMFALTMHLACRVSFGKSYQGRYFNKDKLYEDAFEATDMLGSFTASDFFPYIGRIFDLFSGRVKRLESCFHALDDFYQQVIDEHLDPKRQNPGQEDMVDILLRLQRDQTFTTPLTLTHIKGILMDLFVGGSDTSAMTTVWAMAELARKPETMKKVQTEIRKCVGKKGKVEESAIEQLHFFKMVVKETLRLHPPSSFLIPRECRNHCKIGGYDIFPKTRVLVNVWAIARSNEYWQDPYEFTPERFVNNPVDFTGHDFEFLPFGSGRRICPAIGMGVANIELALANLLYSFDWELPPGVLIEDINMEERFGLTVHKKYPLHLVPVKTSYY